VSPSNLGGGGPDNQNGEAAEVRYHDVTTDASGSLLDLVITTQSSTYLAKNAASGNGLGFFPTAGWASVNSRNLGTMTYPHADFTCADFPASGGNDHCRAEATLSSRSRARTRRRTRPRPAASGGA